MLFAGLAPSFLRSAEVDILIADAQGDPVTSQADVTSNLAQFDLLMLAGIGVQIDLGEKMHGLSILSKAEYNYGLTDITTPKYFESDCMRNQSFLITLGILMDLCQ
mgnify:CR=1 FL=1